MKLLSDEELLEEVKRRFKENKRALQELREATHQILTINKKLEVSEEVKTNFLSNIRNEIINPFSSIILLSKNITSLKDGDMQKAKRMAEMIYSEAFNLDFQLKNIFAAAELEAGEIKVEILPSNINQIFIDVIDNFQDESQKKKLKISLKESQFNEVSFRTDPTKLSLIFSNLLSNAIKFSHQEGEILIEFSITNDMLVIRISDFGIGIAEEDQKFIFNRFSNISSEINFTPKGNGLGLAVTKGCLDLLNGEIEVKSTKGQGSEFIVTIPEGLVDSKKGFAIDANEFLFDDEVKF